MKPLYAILNRLSILCLLLIVLIPALCLSQAQIKQTHRYESKKKNSDENFTIISLKKQGIALLREKNKYNGNKQLWEVVLLDTALHENKKIDLEIKERYPLVGYEIADKHLYLLYRTGETNRNSLELVDINIFAGEEAERHEIKPELDFKVTHFNKVGNNIVLGGYVTNEPAVLLYDLSAKAIKVVPGFFQKDNELVDLRVNENHTFNTVIIDRSLRSERKLVFRTYDETGKLLLDDVIAIDEDKSLQNIISSTLVRDDLILLGTWGDKQGKQSLGFFSVAVDPFGDQKIQYHYFGTMKHYLDYLNPKRAQRIRENSQEDVVAGRKPSFTNYVTPYKIEERPEGFILLAEVYNPSNTMNPYFNSPYSNPYFGNPYGYYNPFWPSYYPGMRMYRPYSYGNNVRNNEEIKTYQTVAASFDSNGKIQWDFSMKLDEVKRPALEQVGDYFKDQSYVYFLYKKESEIIMKTVHIDDETETSTTEKIKLNDALDEIRAENKHDDGLSHWTENTFYVWGYQTLRNLQNKEDKTRDVFYINKIVVK